MNLSSAPPPAGCTCLSLRNRVRAELMGNAPGPCPAHEPQAHAAAETAKAKGEAAAAVDTLRAALGREEPDPETGDALLDAVRQAVPPRDTSNVVPLNAPPSAYDALRPYLNNPTPDGPDAA